MKAICTALLFATILVGCTETTEPTGFANPVTVNMTFPNSWVVTTPPAPIVYTATSIDGLDDEFLDIANVVVEDIRQTGWTLFIAASEVALSTLFDDLTVDSSASAEVIGLRAQRMILTYTVEGVEVQALQYFIEAGSEAISISFATEKASFNGKLAEFESIVATLALS